MERLDNFACHENESTLKQRILNSGQQSTIVYSVRKGGVKVTVNGKSIIDWKGSLTRLTLTKEFAVPNSKALFIGSWNTEFRVTRAVLTPISGRGRILR